MNLESMGNISIEADLVCETGIHIGAQALGISLSRSDNPIVKLGENVPYIPGSSIKGKIRSLLEVRDKKDRNIDIGPEERNARHECDLTTLSTDINEKLQIKAEFVEKEKTIKVEDGTAMISMENMNLKIEGNGDIKDKVSNFVEANFPCDICVVFGRGAERKGSEGPTRIRFEDCFIDDSKNKVKDPVEIKWENVINRLTSSAVPRDIERIKKGTVFKLKITYHVFNEDLDGDRARENLEEVEKIEQLPDKLKRRIKLLEEGIELLERDYLGGMGSRGYGKVRVENLTIQYYPKSFFDGTGEVKTIANAKNVMDIIKRLC